MKRKITSRELLVLQAVVIIYTFAGILGKLAARQAAGGFFLFYCLQIAVLGVYAVLWQQIIKRFELSVAYMNRAAALGWSLLWAALIFGEQITAKKLAGVALVIAGTLIVNGGAGAEESGTDGGEKENAV